MFNSAEIKIGHHTDPINHTGCTVFLLPHGSIASADHRGPATGSREAALLQPTKPVEDINAIVMTGGSAFGLASADGVMKWHADNGIGHWTPVRDIPIVGAAVVYDLFLGNGDVTPDAAMGYSACEAAVVNNSVQGNIGVGSGVTVGKWGGMPGAMKGGFGVASYQEGDLVVFVGTVCNAVGDVVSADGSVLAGARDEDGKFRADDNRFRLRNEPRKPARADISNTSLVFVGTNAKLSKVQCYRVAERAHDGLAMAIRPIHTSHDGDTAFCAATQKVDAPLDWVSNIAAELVAEATRNSVLHATTVSNFQGLA